jgi:hypothetical protein
MAGLRHIDGRPEDWQDPRSSYRCRMPMGLPPSLAALAISVTASFPLPRRSW